WGAACGCDGRAGGPARDSLTARRCSVPARCASALAAVDVRLNNGTATGGHASGDVLANIEGLIGSDFADILKGDSSSNFLDGGTGHDNLSAGGGNDTVYGGNGQDTVSGGGGNDRLLGQAGDDTLEGGAGADTLNGGGGFDVASYAGSSAAVDVRLNNGTATGGDASGD